MSHEKKSSKIENKILFGRKWNRLVPHKCRWYVVVVYFVSRTKGQSVDMYCADWVVRLNKQRKVIHNERERDEKARDGERSELHFCVQSLGMLLCVYDVYILNVSGHRICEGASVKKSVHFTWMTYSFSAWMFFVLRILSYRIAVCQRERSRHNTSYNVYNVHIDICEGCTLPCTQCTEYILHNCAKDIVAFFSLSFFSFSTTYIVFDLHANVCVCV